MHATIHRIKMRYTAIIVNCITIFPMVIVKNRGRNIDILCTSMHYSNWTTFTFPVGFLYFRAGHFPGEWESWSRFPGNPGNLETAHFQHPHLLTGHVDQAFIALLGGHWNWTEIFHDRFMSYCMIYPYQAYLLNLH